MSVASSFDVKERVRQAIDIVELVGSYVLLRREGRGFKALCPWHDDSRPSLQVNPERQSFKCWVCDIGGDVFSFLMKMENVAFPEALAMLAERAGVELKPVRSSGDGPAAGGDDKRLLYQAAAWAEQQFHQCLLKAPEAEPARRYLRERGITEDSILRFHLGFSPDRWDWLIKQALTTSFTPQVLERIGLLVRKQDGPGHYDRFKGRVLFSIRDTQSRPVAVGGRVLPELADQTRAKYVNSPESPLYSKSNLLYALDSARDAIGKSKTVIVMEGYTDCIAGRQCGFDNTVAACGTALGERHIRLLKRFAETIVLVLDGDEAGQKRTNEILDLFLAQGVDLRVLTLPEGLDPCDFLLQRGADAFRDALSQSVDALEHAFRARTRGIDIRNQPHQADRVLEELLHTIAKGPRLQGDGSTEHRLREWRILSRIARLFEVDEQVVRQRITAIRGKQRPTPRDSAESPAAAPREPMNAWDRELLEVLLLEPEGVRAAAEVVRPDQLATQSTRRLFAKCCELSSAGVEPNFDRLMAELEDPELKNLLVELDEHGRQKSSALEPAVRLRDILAGFQHRQQVRQWPAQVRPLEERRLEPAEELDLLEQFQQERTRRGIAARWVGCLVG